MTTPDEDDGTRSATPAGQGTLPREPEPRPTGVGRGLQLAGGAFDWTLRAIVCALFLAIIVVVSAGVFWRYVLDDPLIWSDTIATWLFVWMSLLGAVLAVPLRAHMVADVVPGMLPDRYMVFFRVIYYGSFVVAGALLVRSGLEFVDVTGDRKGTAVDLPLRVPMLAIPVAAFLLCLQGARALANLRSEMRAAAAGEDESLEIGL